MNDGSRMTGKQKRQLLEGWLIAVVVMFCFYHGTSCAENLIVRTSDRQVETQEEERSAKAADSISR